MCMRNNDLEECKLARAVEALDARVDSIEDRLDKFEGTLTVGLTQVSASIQNLAHDFGQRMNILENNLVTEKTKWGESCRKWISWVVLGGLAIIGAACGCEQIPELIKNLKLLF